MSESLAPLWLVWLFGCLVVRLFLVYLLNSRILDFGLWIMNYEFWITGIYVF